MTEDIQETSEKVLPSQSDKDFAKRSLEYVERLTERASIIRNKLEDAREGNFFRLTDIRSFMVSAARYTDTYGVLGTGEERGKRIKTILLLFDVVEVRSDLEAERLWNEKKVPVEEFTEEFKGLINDVFEVGGFIIPLVERIIEGRKAKKGESDDIKEVFYAYCVTVKNLLGLFPNNDEGYGLAKEIGASGEEVDIYFPGEGEKLSEENKKKLKMEFEKLKINLDKAKDSLVDSTK